ncbi:MAG: serine/threonine protein kinase [Myxococcales bacterium]|nr:serine/threonine protein kinase [Myxococcales bacterium]
MSTVIGNYKVVQKLGEGGMGVVYLGEHAVIGRQAAIKLLLPAMSANAEAVARFFNEARATARIKHPGIVEIIDCGQLANGQAYIVMEYLEGETLGAYGGRGGKLSGQVELARAIVRQVAAALSAAHARGIIHRDLKPDNVFLASDGESVDAATVKILDFGIAKLVSAGKVPVITHTKELLGTPVYISPEQCKGAKDLDHRTDIYSLGCIAFELLTGAPVFQADSIGELIGHHMFKAPPSLLELEPSVPPAFAALVMRMLGKAPDDRPRSMDEVVNAIDAEGTPSLLRGNTLSMPPVRPLNRTLPTPPLTGYPTVLAGGSPAPAPEAPAPESTFSGLVSESRPEVPEVPAHGRKLWAIAGAGVVFAVFAWLLVGRAPAPTGEVDVRPAPVAAVPAPAVAPPLAVAPPPAPPSPPTAPAEPTTPPPPRAKKVATTKTAAPTTKTTTTTKTTKTKATRTLTKTPAGPAKPGKRPATDLFLDL